ncbi:hypothetical protein AB0K80_03785 [Streptomyces sp. NPDC052682]|uniref:hypothetical protein n=1 Tax=Streptomyces sp. NPDC052682 TaxID=3154954 RepID=UPI0034274E81
MPAPLPAPVRPSPPHRRLLGDLLAAGEPYGLVLAGGYAVLAHGLVNRLSRSVDVATEHAAGMADIVTTVRAGLEARGWTVRGVETFPVSARLVLTDPDGSADHEAGIHKEVLWRPVVQTELGPALGLEDLVGTRVRALAGRGLPGDLIDVHAASAHWSRPELEELGRRHAPDTFDLSDLQSRLTGTDWLDDREFAVFGLDEGDIAEVRRWAQEWADDIAERLVEGETPEDA